MILYMFKQKWLKLAEVNSFFGALDALLRGYSQIIFCNNPLTGLIVLLGFIDSPTSGILSLLGSVVALLTAKLIRTEPYLVRSGLFCCNGALIGFALAVYLRLSLLQVLLIIFASGLSAMFLKFLLEALAMRQGLPSLSIPFLIVTWLSLLIAHYVPRQFYLPLDFPAFLRGGFVEHMLVPLFPESVNTILYIISGIFFRSNVFLGLIALVGIFTFSRISPLFGVVGGVIGLMLYGALATPGIGYAKELTIGFNCSLIAMALGGFFIRLNWQSTLYTLLAVGIGALAGIGIGNAMSIIDLPPLAATFNLVTLLFLYILKTMPGKAKKLGLERIPLIQVDRPEANASWRLPWEIKRVKRHVKLSLPFSGKWYVFYGNNNRGTHSGSGAYAWDFAVVDKYKSLCRSHGKENEDHYSFGLPVLATADGIVVKVNDSVPDNKPPMTNWEQSWGNFVIIDHGNSEFSEVSHLRQHSIIVHEGDKVIRGQVLGYCGNSGLCMAPHLHFQLQNAGTLGADTIPAKFYNYILHKGLTRKKMKEGIPKEKEFVSNQ